MAVRSAAVAVRSADSGSASLGAPRYRLVRKAAGPAAQSSLVSAL